MKYVGGVESDITFFNTFQVLRWQWNSSRISKKFVFSSPFGIPKEAIGSMQNFTFLKVRFTQKMLVKLSHCHSSEPFFAPGLLFPVNGMNTSGKLSIFSFFCINQINLLKLIQICTYVIINNFIALQAL